MNGSKKWIFWTLGIVAVLGGVGFFIYKRKKNQLASSDKSNSGKGVVNTIVEGAKDVIKDVVGGEAKPVVGTENKKQIDSKTSSRTLLVIAYRLFPNIVTKYFPSIYIDFNVLTAIPIGKINNTEYFHVMNLEKYDENNKYITFVGYKQNNKWTQTPHNIKFGTYDIWAESQGEVEQYIKPSTKIFVRATLTPLTTDFYVNNFFKPTDVLKSFLQEQPQSWNEEGVEEFCKKMKEILTKNFDKLVADAGGKFSFDGNFELSGGRNGGNILDSNL